MLVDAKVLENMYLWIEDLFNNRLINLKFFNLPPSTLVVSNIKNLYLNLV